MRRTVWIGVLLSGLCGGCDDGGAAGSSTTGGTTTDDDVATTIPVTSVSATMPPLTSATGDDTTTGDDTGSTGGSSSGSSGALEPSTGGETGSGGSSSTGGTDGSTSTGNTTAWEIGWCNLQFPSTIEGTTATQTPLFSRLYVEGLTDQSPSNDLDAAVRVEFGYGDDGSDPEVAGWTWLAAEANAGWDGSAVGESNNDEYTVLLTIATPGTYDYAARVSGDAGTTWSYCDLDGLAENGYTSDQAGSATIQ